MSASRDDRLDAMTAAAPSTQAGAPRRRLGPYLPALAIVVLAILTVLNLLGGTPEETTFRTSYSTLPLGHGALYEVLAERGMVRGRWKLPLAQLERLRSALWIIEPESWRWRDSEVAALDAWIKSGGTAVVWLGEDRERMNIRELLRENAEAKETPDPPKQEGTASPQPKKRGEPQKSDGERPRHPPHWQLPRRLGIDAGPLLLPEHSPVSQRLTPAPLQLISERGFVAIAGAAAQDGEALVTAFGEPFVLELSRGSGRLVLIASAEPVTNRHLASGDHVALAYALAKRFGPAVFEETSHGMHERPGALSFLLRTRGRWMIAGLGLVAVLFLWRGLVRDEPAAAPLPATRRTTQEFIEALAALLARTRDLSGIWERYATGVRRQLAQHFGAGAAVGPAHLEALVRRRARALALDEEAIAALFSAKPPDRPAQLLARARRVESLVDRLTRRRN